MGPCFDIFYNLKLPNISITICIDHTITSEEINPETDEIFVTGTGFKYRMLVEVVIMILKTLLSSSLRPHSYKYKFVAFS